MGHVSHTNQTTDVVGAGNDCIFISTRAKVKLYSKVTELKPKFKLLYHENFFTTTLYCGIKSKFTLFLSQHHKMFKCPVSFQHNEAI